MKKIIALLLTFVLALSLSATVFAAEINEADGNPKDTDVTVTTSIDPTYTVTIPANTTVDFNAESTDFGAVRLDAAQIDPGYVVRVTLNASGTLKNVADAGKTIAYTVNDTNGEFTSADYTAAGQSTPLTIDITRNAWDTAFAGDYSDVMTFTISYLED